MSANILHRKKVQDKQSHSGSSRYMLAAFMCCSPLIFLISVVMYFCIFLGSTMFTSLIIFSSMSTMIEAYTLSFQKCISTFISNIASHFRFHFLSILLRPLEQFYIFLYTLLSRVDLGPVAVQCQGSQAAMELLRNCFFLITIFIVVESEYAVIVLNLKALTAKYIRISLLDRIFHGYGYYLHLFISIILYAVVTLVNPVQISVQYLVSMVNIEQFYDSKYYVHRYSSYCDSYPGLPKIDIFMAFGSTAVTSFLIIPIVIIMIRVMIPNHLPGDSKLSECVTLEEEDDTFKYPQHIDPLIKFVSNKLDINITNRYLYMKENTKLLMEKMSVLVKQNSPSCTFLNDNITYYNSIRQEKLNLVMVCLKPLELRYTRLRKIVTGILSVLSPDNLAIRLFILWAAHVFRLIEYEQFLSDATVASVISELDDIDYSLQSEKRAEPSREIVNRLVIVDPNFWKYLGKFIDDDDNLIDFKDDEQNKRLSCHDLMLKVSKELPTAQHIAKQLVGIPIPIICFLINNLITLLIMTCCILGMIGFSQIKMNYFSFKIVGITFYVIAILCDLVSIFVLKFEGKIIYQP